LLSEIEILHQEFVIAQRHEEWDKNDFSHVFSSTILIRRKVLSTQQLNPCFLEENPDLYSMWLQAVLKKLFFPA
jgi:hypothetical protein